MNLSLLPGISVLICTYNGSKVISGTLEHLEKQIFTRNISWEIILVDNASSDGTWDNLKELTRSLKQVVPVHQYSEEKKGKHNAVDLGLKISKYKYVVICDDDNWLAEDYIENAFNIMQSNPSIGILGGKGIVATDGILPPWFETYLSYYAVGDQYYLNGEIKHFWPKYRFIWGAGSVINKEAYNVLIESGFCRILNYKDTGKVSRSEDLELCFAIWLTGYKLWFDNRLIYIHYISQNRLTRESFLEVLKVSISAVHYLKPYNIIKSTGANFAPRRSFWLHHIKNYFSGMVHRGRWQEDIRLIIKILMGRTTINQVDIDKLIIMRKFFSSIKLFHKYETNYRKVLDLQKNIDFHLLKQKDA